MLEKGRITIDQVASIAGVSRTVVSRVLNNKPKVSRETRARVLQIIEEYNYRPSSVARGLSIDRSFEICIIMPRRRHDSMANGYWPLLHLGISEQCVDRGYVVSMTMITAEGVDEVRARVAKERDFDGYILRSGTASLVASSFLEKDIPMVLIGSAPEYPALSSIEVDNFDGAYQATKHLTDLGHRRIALIMGDPEMQESIERRDGFLSALKDAGIEPDESTMAAGRYCEKTGYKIMNGWLAAGKRPTAVVCASDAIAAGVLLALSESGISVPKEVSVIGFDDVPGSAFLIPPLTTISQPIYEKGQQAASILIDAIEGRSSGPVHVRLPAKLVVRRSCASPYA